MSRTFSSRLLVSIALACGLVLPARAGTSKVSAKATAGVDTAAADTVGADTSGAPGRLRISIDESGISIEGKAHGHITKGGGSWVEVLDERDQHYKEKGVDIVKFGKSVFVGKDEVVRGDLVVFGGNAIIEGKVTGNVFVVGGNIRARSGAEIKGDAMVIGGTLDEDDDVIIHGERILFDDLMPKFGIPVVFGSRGSWIHWVLMPVGLFIKLVLAFLVLLFLRDRVVTGYEHVSASFLKAFGAGLLTSFVGTFALLIVMIPLIITVIGIPLALLLVVSCAGIFVIGWTVFAYSLGRLIAERLNFQSDNAFLFVFVGAIVIALPDIIAFGLSVPGGALMMPLVIVFKILAWALRTFAYVTGLGALMLSRFGSRPLRVPGFSPSVPPGGTAPAGGSSS